jgi:hypothetical protein
MGFGATVVLPRRDVTSMLAALDQLSAGSRAWPPALAAGLKDVAGELRSAIVAGGSGNELFECPKAQTLDIAAFLLDAATTLQLQGWHMAAFALEGVEGRLLESLVTGG